MCLSGAARFQDGTVDEATLIAERGISGRKTEREARTVQIWKNSAAKLLCIAVKRRAQVHPNLTAQDRHCSPLFMLEASGGADEQGKGGKS